MVNGEASQPADNQTQQTQPQGNVLQFPGGYRQQNNGAKFLIWVAVALVVTAAIAFILSLPPEENEGGNGIAAQAPAGPTAAAATTPPSSAPEGPSMSDFMAAIQRSFTPPIVINNPGEKPTVLTPGVLTGQEQK